MPQTLVTVDLPQVLLDTAVASTPSAGGTIHVASGGDLQAALNSAVPGDTITLEAGASFSGNFSIPAKSGGIAGGWITVKTDGAVPAEGTQATPANAATMAKIVSPNSVQALSALAPTSNKWRFIGIEFTVDPSQTFSQGIVRIGENGVSQTTLAVVPTDYIFDRCYAHGQPSLDCRKAFSFDSARTALIDSWVDEIHSGQDAQCVTGTNGPGPFKITNNHLESSGENIAWGGADPSIPNLVPSDIEVRLNFFFKPLAWKTSSWNIKNLYESKNSRRTLIEGNYFQHSWPSGQAGFAIVLWSVNQNGGGTWCITEHQTVRKNIIVVTTSGFQLAAKFSNPSPVMNHVAINNNVIIGLDSADVAGGTSRLYQIGGSIPNLSIEHNTGFAPDTTFIWETDTPLTNLIIKNNLTGGGGFQIAGVQPGVGVVQGSVAWALADGAGSEFLGNVVALASNWLNVIPGNFEPQTMDEIGLVGGGAKAYDPTATPSDLALAPAGIYSGAGTDGTDPGADIPAVLAAVSGVTTLPQLTTLTLTPSSASVEVGTTADTFTIVALDENSDPMPIPALTIQSSNPSIAAISVVGTMLRVVGLGAGTTQVSVSSGLIQSAQVQLIITALPPPPPPPPTQTLTSLVLGPSAVSGVANGAVEPIIVGAFDQFDAPMAIPTLTFNSSNASVAQITSISGNRLQVTAYQAGVCHVWVSSGAVVSDRTTVLISDPAGGKSHHRR